jgi:large subunit ribosomal protein L21
LPGKVGGKVTFEDILAVRTDEPKLMTGDALAKITVTGKIVEQGRAKKVIVLKFRRTKQYKIRTGHRQNYTAVEVGEIKLP